jgi:hypothetical protein
MSKAVKESKMIRTDFWPIFENHASTHSIGYIVSTDDIPGLPYPRLGEVYRRPGGWAAWPMGRVFQFDEGPRSDLGFRTRRDAVAHLVAVAQDRVAA